MKVAQYIFFAILGLIIGYFIFSKNPEQVTKVETRIERDTVYITIRDTIKVTRTEIRQEFLRDTLVDYKPKINAFKASKPFTYGGVSVYGEVLGEVLKMDIITDFRLPTITNTITRTETIVKKPSGFFLTAGVSGRFTRPTIGATYIKGNVLIGINTSGFQVGYRIEKK